MLKFLGAVEHALFDTITHFSHGECHQCHFPHFFFFGVLELPKFVLSLRRQVADFTASEKVGEEVAHLVSPSLFERFCADERPFGCRGCCPLQQAWFALRGFVVGSLLLMLASMRSLMGCRAPEGEPFNRNVCWFQFLLLTL